MCKNFNLLCKIKIAATKNFFKIKSGSKLAKMTQN